MSLILNGTTGISDVDGTAAAPAIRGTDTNTGIFFPAADTIAFAEGGVEAARLDSAGNMGLGATPSAWYTGYTASQVGVNGSVWANRTTADTNIVGVGSNQFLNAGATNRLYISNGFATRYEQSSGTHAWYNAASGTAGNAISFTQAMTLDASGNLLVGTTSATGRLTLAQDSASSAAAYINASSASYSGNVCDVRTGTAAGTGYTLISGTNSGGTAFQVLGNGNVRNTNNSYGAISDAKLKENVTEATPKLDKLNQVRIVNYNLIGEEQKQLGVIAQELEQLFPSMIDETPDRDAEGNDLGTTTKGVKYSVFVPMLIKAIQEQQTLITALTTRITALEGAAT